MLKLTKLINLYEEHEIGYVIMNIVYGIISILSIIYVGINWHTLGAWNIPLLIYALFNLGNMFRMLICIDWNYDHEGSGRYYKYIIFRGALMFFPLLLPYWICLAVAYPLDKLIWGIAIGYTHLRDWLIDPTEEK